ncbi:unnamed protein product [[Candida] boidinii]|nr:unnamed protein product [[Candida] boidinii]
MKNLFAHPDGDHLTLLNVYHAFKSEEAKEMGLHKWCRDHYLSYRSLKSADNVRRQLERILERNDLELNSLDYDENPNRYYDNIRKALTSGFFMQVAKKKSSGKGYLTIKDNQEVLIHPSTVLATDCEWVIYNEFVLTSKNYIRTVTSIKPEWLIELAPAYYNLDHFQKGDVKLSLERVKAKVDKYKEVDSKKKNTKKL